MLKKYKILIISHILKGGTTLTHLKIKLMFTSHFLSMFMKFIDLKNLKIKCLIIIHFLFFLQQPQQHKKLYLPPVNIDINNKKPKRTTTTIRTPTRWYFWTTTEHKHHCLSIKTIIWIKQLLSPDLRRESDWDLHYRYC